MERIDPHMYARLEPEPPKLAVIIVAAVLTVGALTAILSILAMITMMVVNTWPF